MDEQARNRACKTLQDKALKLGAEGVKLVAPTAVYTAEWARLKCQFGCDGYGQDRSPSWPLIESFAFWAWSAEPVASIAFYRCFDKLIVSDNLETWGEIIPNDLVVKEVNAIRSTVIRRAIGSWVLSGCFKPKVSRRSDWRGQDGT